jgi:hypothetical protein
MSNTDLSQRVEQAKGVLYPEVDQNQVIEGLKQGPVVSSFMSLSRMVLVQVFSMSNQLKYWLEMA